MSQTVNETRDRLLIGAVVVCALMLALAALGGFSIKLGQDKIIERFDERAPASTRSIGIEYEGVDGESYRVSVTSEPGESAQALMQRFETDLAAMKEVHPSRR